MKVELEPLHIRAEIALDRLKNHNSVMKEHEIVESFAVLVQSGLIDKLESGFQRIAQSFIYDGYLSEDGEIL